MEKYEIKFLDVRCILFGTSPPEFLIEVFFRSLFIYLFLLLIMKILGKRMSGQLTNIEMAITLTLGAIISIAMQSPDRGILLSAFTLIGTLAFERTTGYLSFRFEAFERLTQGSTNMLVKNGVLQLKEMNSARITRQQLYAQIRTKGIFQLGKVRRVYFEPSGTFSIYKSATPKPGMPILPPGEDQYSFFTLAEGQFFCKNCGNVESRTQGHQSVKACSVCGHNDWSTAVN